MKKIFLFALLFIGLNGHAQIKTPAASPSAKVEQAVGLMTVTAEYSRPSKKDRVIFSHDGLVPFGKICC